MFQLHNTVGFALFISLVPVLLLLLHFQIANVVVLVGTDIKTPNQRLEEDVRSRLQRS